MSWGLRAPLERQVVRAHPLAPPTGPDAGPVQTGRALRRALEKPLQPCRRADCARTHPDPGGPPRATRTTEIRHPAPAPGPSSGGGSLTRRGALPAALSADVQGGRDADNRDEGHDHPGDVALHLIGSQHRLVPAQGVADPRENRAPHERAEGGIADELRERHAVQACWDRDEMPHDGKEPPDECTELTVLGEEPL